MTLPIRMRGPKHWHLSSVHSFHGLLSCWQSTYSKFVWIQNNTDFPLPVLQRCTVGTLVLKQWTFWNEITTLPNSYSTQLLLLTLKRTSSQQLQKWAVWEIQFHRKWAAAVRWLFLTRLNTLGRHHSYEYYEKRKIIMSQKSCTKTEERLDFNGMVHCSLDWYCYTYINQNAKYKQCLVSMEILFFIWCETKIWGIGLIRALL